MRTFLILIIFFSLIAGNGDIKNDAIKFPNENCSFYIFNENNLNDSAHFKYYENDSHIMHWYEWWYANLKNGNESIIVMFLTAGDLNNPLKCIASVFIGIFTKEKTIEKVYFTNKDFNLSYEKCNIKIGKNVFYEESNLYFITCKIDGLKAVIKLYPKGIKFGNITKLQGWQWMAWYVAMPYGKGEAEICYEGKEFVLKGNAYHDHNWGIAKKFDLEWDWGEFGCNDFAVIYGFSKGKGGIHFVNDSHHIFIPYGKANIDFLEWKRINGIKKPIKLHLTTIEEIKIDFYVDLLKAYTIGISKIGKPYLMGRTYGVVAGEKFESIGFYEHHSTPSLISNFPSNFANKFTGDIATDLSAIGVAPRKMQIAFLSGQ